MNIEAIKTVGRDTGRAVVPDPADYDHVGDGWSETEYRAVELADDSLGGLWEGEPGRVSFDSWPYTEFCVLVSGRVAVIDAAGGRREFGAGEAFVVPRGFCGTWETVEPSVKYFVAMR
ncbi:cupin domain-containing protein [Streptomyces sulphureus]|uniref:cupin domain-containing protein n=1 Tax=Streptomyces sulphureus TaxID=47758 RepID=UPI00036FC68D|nr:cupin domain-containing protein [Streptomyces sulphureus]